MRPNRSVVIGHWIVARFAADHGPDTSARKEVRPHQIECMVARHIDDRSVFIRELLPQDLKIEIERLTVPDAMKAASFLAGVAGKAHARQTNEKDRKTWSTELKRNRTKTLDAPSWLWSSVVSLIGNHETAYLDIAENTQCKLRPDPPPSGRL